MQPSFLAPQGLFTMCGAGSPELRTGYAVHMYVANTSMDGKAFANADGDLLIVPQQGRKRLSNLCGVCGTSQRPFCECELIAFELEN
jgi:homogentisate 1,2-dioxygenase